MVNEEKITKIAKQLMMKVSTLCKLDGSYAMIKAITDKEKQKAVDNQLKANLGLGISGKISTVIENSIEKQLKELSNSELQQLANLVMNTSYEDLAMERSVMLFKLRVILTNYIIDRAVENQNYSELFSGLDNQTLDLIKKVAEENQPIPIEEVDRIEHGLDEEEAKEVKKLVYSGQGKYWVVLEKVEKEISVRNESES
jgi:hypothetical protein